jgi:hypothetical protein
MLKKLNDTIVVLINCVRVKMMIPGLLMVVLIRNL